MSAPRSLFGRAAGALALALTLGFGSAGCLEPGDPHLSALDTEAPRWVRTVPEPGDFLDREGSLLVTFSEPMDPRSLVAGLWLQEGGQRLDVAIEVPPETGDVPPAISQQRPQPSLVRVLWSAPLPAATTVTLVLDTVLIDRAGNSLEGPDGGLGQIRLTYRTP